MEWMERYDRKKRPGLNEIREHLPPGVAALFFEFADHLARRYRLHCAPAVYTKANGWVFLFGRSDLYMIEGVGVGRDFFDIHGIQVRDRESLGEALALADRLYEGGFGERLAAHAAQRSAEQGERTKKRLEREKREIADMAARIDPERFNKYRWSAKVSRRKLKQLYESDAAMLYDEALADDIGYALYARCLQGRDERAPVEAGKMKCHGCGAILGYRKGLIECDCGGQYLFRDYMRSFRTNNMPSGSATHIFNDFIDSWPRASGYAGKMRLIDALVHEFHINLTTGVKGRFVGINLIEGTKKQIEELILSLACGEETAQSKDAFTRNLR